MLEFQPVGFGRKFFETSLGGMAYYTPNASPWRTESDSDQDLPTLIFLHSLGGGSSAFEWSKVYPAFAPTHRVIAPDLIGWGSSAHPMRDYSNEDYLMILGEMLEQVGTQPVAIAATSLTAGLTIRLAIQHPDRIQSLFLVSPSGYGDFGNDYQRSISAQLASTPILDRLIYSIGAANEFAIENFLEQFLFANPDRISDEIVEAYLASALQPNAEYAALASLKGSICFDLSQYVPKLTIPTLMVWGAKSRFSSASLGRRLAKLNPEVIHIEEIPDLGVLLHLEYPAVAIALLQRWLKQRS